MAGDPGAGPDDRRVFLAPIEQYMEVTYVHSDDLCQGSQVDQRVSAVVHEEAGAVMPGASPLGVFAYGIGYVHLLLISFSL